MPQRSTHTFPMRILLFHIANSGNLKVVKPDLSRHELLRRHPCIEIETHILCWAIGTGNGEREFDRLPAETHSHNHSALPDGPCCPADACDTPLQPALAKKRPFVYCFKPVCGGRQHNELDNSAKFDTAIFKSCKKGVVPPFVWYGIDLNGCPRSLE